MIILDNDLLSIKTTFLLRLTVVIPPPTRWRIYIVSAGGGNSTYRVEDIVVEVITPHTSDPILFFFADIPTVQLGNP